MQRERSYHGRRPRVDRAGWFVLVVASVPCFGCATERPAPVATAERPAPREAPAPAPAPPAPAQPGPVVRVELAHATGWWASFRPGPGVVLIDADVPGAALMPKPDLPLDGPRALLDAWVGAADCEVDEHGEDVIVIVPRGRSEVLLDVVGLQLEDARLHAALARSSAAGPRPVRVLVTGVFAGGDEDELGVDVPGQGLVVVDRRGLEDPSLDACSRGDRVRVVCGWRDGRLRFVRFD